MPKATARDLGPSPRRTIGSRDLTSTRRPFRSGAIDNQCSLTSIVRITRSEGRPARGALAKGRPQSEAAHEHHRRRIRQLGRAQTALKWAVAYAQRIDGELLVVYVASSIAEWELCAAQINRDPISIRVRGPSSRRGPRPFATRRSPTARSSSSDMSRRTHTHRARTGRSTPRLSCRAQAAASLTT